MQALCLTSGNADIVGAGLRCSVSGQFLGSVVFSSTRCSEFYWIWLTEEQKRALLSSHFWLLQDLSFWLIHHRWNPNLIFGRLKSLLVSCYWTEAFHHRKRGVLWFIVLLTSMVQITGTWWSLETLYITSCILCDVILNQGLVIYYSYSSVGKVLNS